MTAPSARGTQYDTDEKANAFGLGSDKHYSIKSSSTCALQSSVFSDAYTFMLMGYFQESQVRCQTREKQPPSFPATPGAV